MSNSFVASVFTVAGGTAIAQAIAIATLPFITRLFSPDAYGAFVIFLAYGGIVSAVVCGRFEVAIALPKRHRCASAVAIGGLAVAVGMSALTGAMVIAFAGFLPWLNGLGGACLPLYVLLNGVLLVFSAWSARTRAYRRLSLSRIAQSAVVAIVAIASALAVGGTGNMLIVATLAGQVIALVVLVMGLSPSGFAFAVRPRQVLRLLRHFRRLAVFNVPHVLSDAAQGSGLPLLVASLFGAHAAAYYSFSIRLLKAPLGLISSAISQVYYVRAAAHRNDNPKLRREALRILRALAIGALLMLPMLLIIPNSAFAWAFGSSWGDVGVYLRTLSPWILASFVAAPMSVLYLVKEEFALDFYLGLGGSVLAFAILGAVPLVSDDVLVSMWALSIGMTAYVVATTYAEFAIVFGRSGKHA
jgi:O-antigen/teichoic acid export membrane protein